MNFNKEVSVKPIFVIWLIDNDGRKLYNLCETIEDAYDICKNFLNDEFQLTADEIKNILYTGGGPDYIDIFNPKKISSTCVYFTKKENLKNTEYFFRIWKTSTIKIYQDQTSEQQTLTYDAI